MSKKALLYSLDVEGHACWQIRLADPFDRMQTDFKAIWGVVRKKNWFYKHKSIATRPISSSDLVIVQRYFPQPRTAQVLGRLTYADAAVVFDLDDNLIELPQNHKDYPALEGAIPYMREFMSLADAVTVSTPELAKVATELNQSVHVLPNLVNEALWTGGRRSPDGKLVILFAGTPTHTHDAMMIESVLIELYKRYPEKISFTFMGCITERLAELPGAKYIDFQSSYSEYAKSLQDEPVDLAVVPLEDTPFNRCKSNIKWLEYSMCGIPGVYAAMPPYREIQQGRTGLLARSASDWLEALDVLVREDDLRRTLAEEARTDVVTRFSLANQLDQYLNLYEMIIAEKQERLQASNRSWFWGRLLGR